MTGAARFFLASVFLLSPAVALSQAVQPPSRDVTPPGMTPGPKVDGPLVREPAPPRPPPEARWRRFFLPLTTDAATLVVEEGKKTIHVAGVEPPPPDAVCPFGDGTEWPCGRTALHSFRMFLGGRAVECYFPYAESAVTITAPCRVGQADIGLWLLAQGWGRPSDLATDGYRKAAREAECAGRGVWKGRKPEDTCPKPAP